MSDTLFITIKHKKNMETNGQNKNENEQYLTIKEISYELRKRGLPYSRPIINRLRKQIKFVYNRAKLSEVLDALGVR